MLRIDVYDLSSSKVYPVDLNKMIEISTFDFQIMTITFKNGDRINITFDDMIKIAKFADTIGFMEGVKWNG